MFEKLFMLVKNNAGTAVINNPMVPAKYHEAVINDASSSVIEALKGLIENGKLKELIKYFDFQGLNNNPLINSIVTKFANKLNNYYSVEPTVALQVAKDLITPVMQKIITRSKNEADADFALSKLLALFTGAQPGGIAVT